MLPRITSSLFLLFVLGLQRTAFATDLMIDFWSVSLDREPLPMQTVNVGDTITFKTYGPHDVWVHPSMSCNQEGRIEIASVEENVVTYTFTEKDSSFFGNTMFFSCDAGTHCDMGQYIIIKVFPLPETSPPAAAQGEPGKPNLSEINEQAAADSANLARISQIVSALVLVGTWLSI